MTIFVYVIIVCSCLLFRRSKTIYYITLLFLFILFGGNLDNTDRHIYESRFYQYDDEIYLAITEPVYTELMKALNKIGLELQHYIALVAFFFFYSVNRILNRFTLFGCFVLGFYMLTEFFFDVVQVRYSTGLIFLYLGFYYLLTEKEKRKAITFYVVLVLCGSLFHFSIAYYLLFALTRILSPLQCCIFVIAFVLFFGILLHFLSEYAEILAISHKLETIERGAFEMSKARLIFIRIRILFFETIPFIFLMITYRKQLSKDLFLMIFFKSSILLWTAVPLLYISLDFHRTYFAMMIFIIMSLSRIMMIKKRKKIIVYAFSFLTILSFVYDMYIKNAGFIQKNVILPVLTQNMIL